MNRSQEMQKAPIDGIGPRTPTAVREGPPSPSRWSSLNTDDAAYAMGIAAITPTDGSALAPTGAAPTDGAADPAGHLAPALDAEEVCVSDETCTYLICHLMQLKAAVTRISWNTSAQTHFLLFIPLVCHRSRQAGATAAQTAACGSHHLEVPYDDNERVGLVAIANCSVTRPSR